MDRGLKSTEMGTSTKVNLLMGFLKVMVNIIGQMEQSLKEILSKVLEMDMDYGKVEQGQAKTTKDITCLIRNMAMEYITGGTAMCIKDFGWMTFASEKESYSLTIKSNIMDTGKMEKKSIINLI